MDIRLKTTNTRVDDILKKVSRKNRRIFIQEAILYYYRDLTKKEEVYSTVLDVEKKKDEGLDSIFKLD